jgi:predicted RNA binding protein YcfA (HicA-like mRNA interferase family)
MNQKKLLKFYKKNSFVLDRVSGSHHMYMLPNRSKRVIVPLHKKDLPIGTLLSILKQAGIDKTEL